MDYFTSVLATQYKILQTLCHDECPTGARTLTEAFSASRDSLKCLPVVLIVEECESLGSKNPIRDMACYDSHINTSVLIMVKSCSFFYMDAMII